jgi:REP element-mobilizing transposase RayT
MILSAVGKAVAEEWQRIPLAHPRVSLDEWVIMPDHVHGILIFGEETPELLPKGTGLLAGSLGAVIGQFKSKCTKRIWKARHRDFNWQDRFHDQIIRNERALHEIRQYIRENPLRWSKKYGPM